jgi:ABC-type amino acid transport substrate-binding protein
MQLPALPALALTLLWALTTLHAYAAPAQHPLDAPAFHPDASLSRLKGVCPDFAIRCVLDGNWAKPVGYLDKKRA